MNKTPKLRFKEFSGDWKEKRFNTIFLDIKNKTGDTVNYPLYSLTIEKGVVPKSERYEREFLVTKDEDNFKVVNKDEFVYNPMNLRFGALARHKEDKSVSVSGYYNVFKVIDDSPCRFWDNYLKTNRMMYLYNTIATGSLIEKRRVHFSQFIELNLPVPSKSEQEKIASFFSLIDDKISLQGEKFEALKDYKNGMMQKIFSRELRFKDDDGRDYPEWEERRFKDFVKINQGLQIPISDRYTSEGENRYFYITNEFLKSSSDTKYYIENPPKSVICKEDDILMTRTGNTGKVVTRVSGAFHNNFFKIDYDRYKYNKMFLYYVLTSHKIQKNIIRLAGTSTIPDLNHGDFYNIKIQLPTKKEQDKMARLLIDLDIKIEKEQVKLDSLNEYKKGLLQQMLV